MLTADEIKRHFAYDPVTGRFTRLTGVLAGEETFLTDDGQGYRVAYVGRHGKVRAHRAAWAIMTGTLPECGVDHKNQNRADNRWKNLRLATRSENGKNAKKSKANTSGVVGVTRFRDKWKARIVVSRRDIHLGVYSTISEAAAARKEAEKCYGFSLLHGS